MVNARLFEREDYLQIESWFQARDLNPVPKDMIPSTGFIVDGIAAGFLYLTNSSVAVIDCFISNPVASKGIRNEALDEITRLIISYAHITGVKHLKCSTKLDTIKDRAIKHGFKDDGLFISYSMRLNHG